MSNILDKKEYYIKLFDLYQELLTENQIDIFTMSYFEDLSLMEISEIHNVSRSAIHNSLDKTIKHLDRYEEKLNLYDKYQQIESNIISLKNKYPDINKDLDNILDTLKK